MRKIREVLRLKYDLQLGHRQIGTSVGMCRSTVDQYVKRVEKAGLPWEAARELSDAALEARLFQQVGRNEPPGRAPINLGWVHLELRRPGVTLQLLWTEYQEAVVAGGTGQRPYQYSQFCDLYRDYRAKLQPSMRQVHRAGEKSLVDFSGKKPRIYDPKTGEATEVELFIAVLAASSYTYAEATRTQQLEDFVGATERSFLYFGGVSEMVVPDQLKSAVKTSDWYEPEINETYAELAQHYGTAIVPARPGKPRDKAKVEGAVLIAQRYILASLRNRRFFSLEELNAAIRELLEKLNTRPFQKLEGCRRSVFLSLELPAMRPLPARRFELGRWKRGVGVNIDYHVEYDHRHYSVPFELIQERVDIRASERVIEIFRGGERVTSHERSYGPKGTAVTKPEHRPRSHREVGEWPPERLVAWAGAMGPSAGAVAAAILARGPHPESGRRACLGLLRLGERYGSGRLNAACERALQIGNPTRKSVVAILKTGLDKIALPRDIESPRVMHENVRGGDYFDRREEIVSTAKEEEEKEDHYLREERLGITMDSLTATQEPPDGASPIAPPKAAPRAAPHSSPASAGPPPSSVVELLQRLKQQWTRSEPKEEDEADERRARYD